MGDTNEVIAAAEDRARALVVGDAGRLRDPTYWIKSS